MIPIIETPKQETLDFIIESKKLLNLKGLKRAGGPTLIFEKLYKVVFKELFRQQTPEIQSCYKHLFHASPPVVTYGVRFLIMIELLSSEHHSKNEGYSIKLGANALKIESGEKPTLNYSENQIMLPEKRLQEKRIAPLIRGATANEQFDLDAPTPSELRKLNLGSPKKQRAVAEIKEFFGLNEISEEDLRQYLGDCTDLKIKIVSLCPKSEIVTLLSKLNQIEAKGLQFAKTKNGDQ